MPHVWVKDKSGREIYVDYDDLDSDIYPQIFKPVGGFCYALNDFVRLELPQVPYYVRGWLPKQGKALLYAPPKSGKSFLTYQLAHAIAHGKDFLGLPTSKGRVLIFQFELGEEVLQSRIRGTGRDYEGVYAGTTFNMKLDTQDGQDQFERAVDAIKPDVVIIDPLYKTIREDENESHDLLKIFDFLDRIILEYRCSMFIMDHTGKDKAKGARGSSVKEDWVDTYIKMDRTTKLSERLKVKITTQLIRHTEPIEKIEAEMTDKCCFEVALPSPTTLDKVREYFEQHPAREITVAQLVKEELGQRKSVDNARRYLLEEGVIVQTGYGRYQLSGGEQAG